MSRPRIDARGWWLLAGTSVFVAVTAVLIFLADLHWGGVPAWVVAAGAGVVAIGVAAATLFSWRGGRRARSLEARSWLRTGMVPSEMPLRERIERLNDLNDAFAAAWARVALSVFWIVLTAVSRHGLALFVVAGFWVIYGAASLYRALRHRQVASRLLDETMAEARAAGFYSTVV